jgi:hypothetical protein
MPGATSLIRKPLQSDVGNDSGVCAFPRQSSCATHAGSRSQEGTWQASPRVLELELELELELRI